MSDQELPATAEDQEHPADIAELLDLFEEIGLRLWADYESTATWGALSRNRRGELEQEYRLSSGDTAKFEWIQRPQLNRPHGAPNIPIPENFLPSGHLKLFSIDADGMQTTTTYIMGRQVATSKDPGRVIIYTHKYEEPVNGAKRFADHQLIGNGHYDERVKLQQILQEIAAQLAAESAATASSAS